MNQFTQQVNQLINTPFEQWPIHLKAVSANANGRVNSFLTSKYYGYRKHEFVNGAFTGKQWFVVELR